MAETPVGVATDFWKGRGYTEAAVRATEVLQVEMYLVFGVFMRFLTDFMLLLASGKMYVEGGRLLRILAGAAVSGGYAAACSALPALNHGVLYLLTLGASCLLAFGGSGKGVQKSVVFFLFRLGLDVLGQDSSDVMELVGAGILGFACFYAFRQGRERQFLPVKLRYQNKELSLQALYDTGHQLCDPLTGRQVLVVGADVAQRLTGLTCAQLKKPVENVGAIPGLRLVPCKTVAGGGTLLLALQLRDCKIGGKKGSVLVALAPQVLDSKGEYQALTGGMV